MGKVVKAVAALAVVALVTYLAPPLGAALGKALALSAVGTAVATAVISIGLSIAAGMALSALGPRAPRPTAEMGAPTILRQSLTDSFILYGRRRTQYLKMVFYHSRTSGEDQFRYFVYAVAGHRILGNPTWMLNDEVVTVDGSGMVTTGPYANNAWLWLQRGLDPETANATFVSECGGKWTSSHRGDGIAAIYFKAKITPEVQQAGFATPTAIVDGKDDIYDPRTEAEGYTRNAVLCCYDWMRLPREEGGFGAWPDEIPSDDWIAAQANVCDETVDGEARYAIDALIVTGAAPSDIRNQFIINMAGDFTYSGGVYELRPGYYQPVSETLHQRDLAGGIRVSRFGSDEVTANQILGNYVDPNEGYQGMPFTPRTLPGVTDIQQMSIDLAFVTSRKRADRIANIMLNRAGAELRVQWPTNIMGMLVKPLSTVMLDTDRHELSNPAFKVRGWSFTPDFNVSLVLHEESEDFYDPPTPATVTTPPRIDKPNPIGMPTDGGAVVIDPIDGIDATDVQGALEELAAKTGYRGAIVRKASNQAGANFTAGGAITFDQEIADTDGIHSNLTNTSRLTVPAGVTRVKLEGQVAIWGTLDAGQWARANISKNGASDFGGDAFVTGYADVAGDLYLNLATPELPVTAGDYFELRLVIESDASVTLHAARTWFSLRIIE
jgi:hypothetical protein